MKTIPILLLSFAFASCAITEGGRNAATGGGGLKGMSKEAVTAWAQKEGQWIRVIEDGESGGITLDYWPERLNVKIVDGIVTSYWNG